jgi:hypothetical protein
MNKGKLIFAWRTRGRAGCEQAAPRRGGGWSPRGGGVPWHTGSVTGPVTGSVTGPVTGSVTGSVTRSVTGIQCTQGLGRPPGGGHGGRIVSGGLLRVPVRRGRAYGRSRELRIHHKASRLLKLCCALIMLSAISIASIEDLQALAVVLQGKIPLILLFLFVPNC